MTERRIRFAGLSVRVREEGDGPPVLLVHGLGANLTMWGPLLPQLRNRRRITLDLPGTGRSSTPLLPIPVRGLAALVSRVLDELGAETVDLLGYSFGGAVAQELALRDRTACAVSCRSRRAAAGGAIPGSLRSSLTSSVPIRYYSPALYEWTFDWTAGGRRPRREEMHRQADLRRENPPTWLGYIWQALASSGWSSLSRLRSIRHPTLVVSGSEDPLVPLPNARLLAHGIPGPGPTMNTPPPRPRQA
jgi:pimeloyl-ACP methyl ester carboxylesterase